MDTPSSISSDVMGHLDTRLAFFGNDFPSDNLTELFRRLHRWSKDKKFCTLASFLEECVATIKNEILGLSQPVPREVSALQTILGLVEGWEAIRTTPIGGALESALLCMLQVGVLIGSYEATGKKYNIAETGTTLAGLSIGILSAAAVAVSQTLFDLAKYGVESVRIAFRMGIHVDHVSQSLEAREPEGPPKSWAYVVTGVSADVIQQELDRFNKETSNPQLTKVFISAADANSVSVTGPPSRLLNAFHHSAVLRYSKHLPLPVYNGLCHASHLYTSKDSSSILAVSDNTATGRVYLPVLSAKTGKPYVATQARKLWEEIVLEILTGGIYLDNLTEGIVREISIAGSPEVDVFLLRTSLIAQGILSSISSNITDISIRKTDLLDWCLVEEPDFYPSTPRSPHQSKLAVVGMSCRLPGGANDLELFWKIMEEGRDVHTRIPADRFDVDAHYDPTGEKWNTTQTPFGNFIDAPGMFDANFFNMSPREAEQTDPMHRLALVTAYEALEMAGYAPNRTPSSILSRIGTYYGQASDDWRELNAGMNIGTYAVPGGERAFANGRINYFFKFGGPSFNVDTACSSGLAAVNQACSALWAGEVDTAIAGGLNVITNPDNFAMLCKGHFLSKTGQCKVWDKDADGYCRADGIGSVVIKRLEDAVADNDNILATIDAAYTNQSADAISITHPHAGAQKENYRQVMQAAGISPVSVSYVELHGTGTQAGDSVESESVVDVFANPKSRRQAPLLMGAVKSNIGHGEAAAGIASLLKVLLIFQKNMIPPHVGIKTEINPVVAKNLERCKAGLALEMTPWPRMSEKKRYAIVNSFGAHGGNTTLLLEDAPQSQRVGSDSRHTHVISLSAKSKASLKGNIEALAAYLEHHPETDLGDLAYTTCVRRIQHHTRFAFAASSIDQVIKSLSQCLANDTVSSLRPVSNASTTVPFAFTGQGAFYTKMGHQLYQEFPTYRTAVEELDRLAQRLGLPSVIPLIDGTETDEQSVSPILTQLAIVVTEIALVRFWASLGITPSVVIGHSLGEYAALVAADVLSAADAIFLVGKRAELILRSCNMGSHVMLAVRAGVDQIEKMAPMNAPFEVSCVNSAQSTVIGGSTDNIQAIRAALEKEGLKCTPLNLPFAFHTEQMEPILDTFEQVAQQVSFRTPSVPILSPLLSDCVFDGKTVNAKYLRRASRESVNFVEALEAGRDMGVIQDNTSFIEIGPHPINGSFIKAHMPQAQILASMRKSEDNFTTLAGSLASLQSSGLQIDWNAYFKPFEKSLRLVPLPKYSWNEKNYWLQYTGTWTLDKAYPQEDRRSVASSPQGSALRTSSIHRIMSEEVVGSTAALTVLSDIMDPEFRAAVDGHHMNGYGVATSSLWGDMAMTIGEYLYKRLVPQTHDIHMDVSNLEVLHAQVAHTDKSRAQLLQVEAKLDLSTKQMAIQWFNVSSENGRAAEPYATATVLFGDALSWRKDWDRLSHLVNSRIASLSQMALDGTANRLSRGMAYTLFKNVVDYTDHYRGMQSVVLDGMEAYAEITLSPDLHGTWHTPPYWIDSLFHIGGFVLNGSDASNTKDYFYVTPGWGSCRIAQPLVAGGKYRSYVRMAPTEEKNMYAGDVYVLQDGAIVGMMGEMKFRRVPRVLMNQFFSPSEATSSKTTVPTSVVSATPTSQSKAATVVSSVSIAKASTPPVEAAPQVQATESAPTIAQQSVTPASSESPIITDCLKIIARETGLDPSELVDTASFVELGVDSLMSLVLSEKFRVELNVDVKSSVFIECPNIGELKAWLDQ
ncbi:polyketide synthase [Penicillium argentinense]|uniref:Polyketide synthase n=1 Tax=Penicillium argentinense TaxID=1131581 RepID=A0A9W9EWM6_9EURO|nr:polyketide synthase [Penicillium argentinense]KAJ5089210.1 polyketide synthase [Penicillium argentinense]